MRMDTDREPDSGPPRSEIARLRNFRLIVSGENHEDVGDPRALRAIDDLDEIGGEFRARDVAMGVNYRTRAPGGTGSSKLTRIGLPSATLAASTMPFDSMPISLAGFRLKTIAIVRPTSCSG